MDTRDILYKGGPVVIVIGIFIACFAHITTFVGNKEQAEYIKNRINDIKILCLLGAIFTTIMGCFIYYMNPALMMYLLLFVAFMGFGLAWAACAIALITRK
jgi:hypothetical protein